MKKTLLTVLFAGLLAAAASAFAQASVTTQCVTCGNETAQAYQNIKVTVPPVVKLVIDNNKTTDKNWLPDWNVNLGGNLTSSDLNGCYVVPNWVGFTQSLNDFLQAADAGQGNFSGLVPALASYGYPPVIRHADGQVVTWNDVVTALKLGSDSPYIAGDHGKDPAKGNLVCTNAFTIEKYTNCPGVAFFVSVSQNSGEQGGYGMLLMTDQATYSGTDIKAGGAGFTYFAPVPIDAVVPLLTGGTAESGKAFNGIDRGVWIDDAITQLLWLKNSTAGDYSLKATYTLGTATAAGYKFTD